MTRAAWSHQPHENGWLLTQAYCVCGWSTWWRRGNRRTRPGNMESRLDGHGGHEGIGTRHLPGENIFCFPDPFSSRTGSTLLHFMFYCHCPGTRRRQKCTIGAGGEPISIDQRIRHLKTAVGLLMCNLHPCRHATKCLDALHRYSNAPVQMHAA
jgi:hypothetical protein